MIRANFFALALLAVAGCSGVLSYQQGDSVFVGPLNDKDINKMNSSGKLVSKNSFDDMQFAIDRGGNFVGTCRTIHTKRNSRGTITTPGTMQVNVFNILRKETITASEITFARAIDSKLGNKLYESLIARDRDYLHCYAMGASGNKGTLVFYIQPQLPSFESLPQNLAVEVDVKGSKLQVVQIELFDRSAAPTTVVAFANPLKGNSIGIDPSSGAIEINGTPVELNGTPVGADIVKHYFE